MRSGLTRCELVVLAVTAAGRLALMPLFDFAVDDAYITFRVARNLAGGMGMVYNPGEAVLATTTPFYAMLMAPGELLGIGAPLWSAILNSLAAGVAYMLLYRLLRTRVRRSISFLAVLSLVISPMMVQSALTGMESVLFSMLVLLTVLLFAKGRDTWAGLTLALCVLTRPEAALLALAFLVTLAVRERRRLIRLSVPLAAVGGAWLAYTLVTFGSPVPSSFYAKLSQISLRDITFAEQAGFFLEWGGGGVPLLPLVLLLLPLGLWRSVRERDGTAPLSAWVIAVVLLQLTSRVNLASWYMDMMAPMMVLVGALGAERVLEIADARGRRRWTVSRRMVYAAAALVVAWSLWSSWRVWGEVQDIETVDGTLGDVAAWLCRNGCGEDMTIALEPIGRIGYGTDLRILDTFGLASPEVHELIPKYGSGLMDAIVVELYRPELYLTDMDRGDEFVFGYVRVASFRNRGRISKPMADSETWSGSMFLYARSDVVRRLSDAGAGPATDGGPD